MAAEIPHTPSEHDLPPSHLPLDAIVPRLSMPGRHSASQPPKEARSESRVPLIPPPPNRAGRTQGRAISGQPAHGEDHEALAGTITPETIGSAALQAAANETVYRTYNQELRRKIAELGARVNPHVLTETEGYIGSGASHHVWKLPGGTEVIKVPVYDGIPNPALDDPDLQVTWDTVRRTQKDTVRGLENAKGHDKLEQLVKHIDIDSPQGGAIICKYIEGKTLADMSAEERAAVPQQHFDELIRTLGDTIDRNILFDDLGAAGNIIHHPDTGFILLDFGAADHIKVPRHADELVRRFSVDVLFQSGFRDGPAPQDAQAFYKAYRRAFGVGSTAVLRDLWRRHAYHMPDNL
jgi:hypothetical protein